jgi:hypothetical protein
MVVVQNLCRVLRNCTPCISSERDRKETRKTQEAKDWPFTGNLLITPHGHGAIHDGGIAFAL